MAISMGPKLMTCTYMNTGLDSLMSGQLDNSNTKFKSTNHQSQLQSIKYATMSTCISPAGECVVPVRVNQMVYNDFAEMQEIMEKYDEDMGGLFGSYWVPIHTHAMGRSTSRFPAHETLQQADHEQAEHRGRPTERRDEQPLRSRARSRRVLRHMIPALGRRPVENGHEFLQQSDHHTESHDGHLAERHLQGRSPTRRPRPQSQCLPSPPSTQPPLRG